MIEAIVEDVLLDAVRCLHIPSSHEICQLFMPTCTSMFCARVSSSVIVATIENF